MTHCTPLNYWYAVNLIIDCYNISNDVFEVTDDDMKRIKLIFPGTKWCGPGDIAKNENDLGRFANTDRCCRSHDRCPDFIEGFGTKYGLTNPKFYTRLHCDCDLEFYYCLKNASDGFFLPKFLPNKIGTIYFNLIGTQCYKEDYPIKGCKSYRNYLHKKCVDYEQDHSKPKLYQYFDIPDF